MSATADPKSAREHARAQGGTRVETMPTLPPVADDLPAGVAAEDLVWEETVAPGGYTSRRIARGTRLRLIDKAGDACASLNIFNAEMPTERLNVADTVKVQWNAYLGEGKLLLSDMGRVLASIMSGPFQVLTFVSIVILGTLPATSATSATACLRVSSRS